MSGTLEEVPPMNVPADGVPASSQMNHSSSKVSKAMVILGAQWGDEGKGKAVDQLAAHVDIVCRCQVLIFIFVYPFSFFFFSNQQHQTKHSNNNIFILTIIILILILGWK